MSNKVVSPKNPSVVLVVEDDTSIQKIYKKLMEDSGISVLQAFNITQAEDLISKNSVDLIVLDIMLSGGKNGFDFLKEVRNESAIKNVPAIVLSNLDSEEETAVRMGANAYMVKANSSTSQVMAKINALLHK